MKSDKIVMVVSIIIVLIIGFIVIRQIKNLNKVIQQTKA